MTEIRTTSSTGGQKGVKEERYDLLPKLGLDAIARVFAFGATKYADHNWRRGYEWGKSYAALQRHLQAFWEGETNDPESGLPHLGHAGFHVLVLLTWLAEQGEGRDNPFDDRWRSSMEPVKDESDAAHLFVAPVPPNTNTEWVVEAARDLQNSWDHDSEHPEDASSEWSIEYRHEVLEEAMRQYRENGPDAKPVFKPRPVPEGWKEVGFISADTEPFELHDLSPHILVVQNHINAMVERMWAEQRLLPHPFRRAEQMPVVDLFDDYDAPNTISLTLEQEMVDEDTLRLLVGSPREFTVDIEGVISADVVTEALQRFHNKNR